MFFGGMLNEMAERHPLQPKQFIDINMLDSIEMNPSILVPRLSNINNIDDNLLFQLLQEAYTHILDKSFIDTNSVLIANLFTNERFVEIFTRVLSAKTDSFTLDQKINCNRLIYDFMIYKKDPNIMNLLYGLARTINRDSIPRLYGYGFSNKLIIDLIISRYSTKDQKVAMKRVNCTIMNSDIDMMTEQNIVYIYEKFFDHLSPMFEGIMFDVWEADSMTINQEEIYGRITLAILDILNESPLDVIYAVLKNYAQTKCYLQNAAPVRINLKSIAVSDYGRICQMVDLFEQSERELVLI